MAHTINTKLNFQNISSKFRPSTAVNSQRLNQSNNARRERPMTSNKYKNAYATLLAKTRSSTEEFKLINAESERYIDTNCSDLYNGQYKNLQSSNKIKIPGTCSSLLYKRWNPNILSKEENINLFKSKKRSKDYSKWFDSSLKSIFENDNKSIRHENKIMMSKVIKEWNEQK